MLSLPTSLVLLLSFAFVASQSSAPATSSATRASSSAPPSTVSSHTTQFANITTTDSRGSTVVTSIPITVNPSSGSLSATSTSAAPFPSLSGYPTCVTDCLTHAVADANCTSITEVNCYCSNKTFPADLFSCVSAANCTTNISSAESLAQQFCGLASTSLSLSFPSTSAPPSSASPSSSTSPPSSSATSSSAVTPSPSTSNTAIRSTGWILCGSEGAAFGISLLGVLIGAMLL
ncbi:hypothetical protein BV25DRAFT_945030 [Artomyces pyxidatus]|uniref:Uncharacterized protein n=1 Tax=Artomyces pyxidatus TaxID=48021 RepID=A0ACB8SWM7_9AGAM|nr:hypothetical protein BV25DRAFT_945030 [Artomyces pyxidatus]